MPGAPSDRVPAARKRTGRPRLDSRPVVGDPTDEILGAAARLFGEHGVSGTTMSLIAREVGLKQSSLYYYFRSRDDTVLALLKRANVVPLELVDRVIEGPGTVPEKLYRFVMGDVEALCALPFDINEVHRIAARDPDAFHEYWSERARLEQRLASLLRSGAKNGTLRPVNARATALTIMSNDEGVQNWYRLGTSKRPADIARDHAELTVAGLLPDHGRIARIAAHVQEAERRRPNRRG